MGLSKVDNHYKLNKGTGWKIYLKDINGILRSLVTRDIVLENEWMLSEDRRGQNINKSVWKVGENEHYKKGFHIYENKPHSSYLIAISMDWEHIIPKDSKLELRKVEFEDVITSGTESRYFPVAMGKLVSNVIISNKIKVLPMKNKITNNKKVKEMANKF